jgi:hypothetical protein
MRSLRDKALPSRTVPDLKDACSPVIITVDAYGIHYRRRGSRQTLSLPHGRLYYMAAMAYADSRKPARPVAITRGRI